MREIKFRAYTSLTGKMHYGVELTKKEDGWFWISKDGMLQNHPNVESTINFIMQYTGLLDKNGKEIYEGDILDISCHIESYKKKRKSDSCILQLKYCDGVYNLFSLDGSIPYTCVSLVYGINPKQTEVIGNIYENPELLETS